MDLHPVVEATLAVILGGMALVAVVWLYAGYGAWMDDAFDNGRWAWFGALLLFSFPASLFSWLIVRALRHRPAGRPAKI